MTEIVLTSPAWRRFGGVDCGHVCRRCPFGDQRQQEPPAAVPFDVVWKAGKTGEDGKWGCKHALDVIPVGLSTMR